jgi:hypothetical protein
VGSSRSICPHRERRRSARSDRRCGCAPSVHTFAAGGASRRSIEQFPPAFDSNLAPIVGQQVTLTNARASAAGPRIDLLIARAAAGDLIVKGVVADEQRGWYRNAAGQFVGDRRADQVLPDAQLRALAMLFGEPFTYACVSPGSGQRLGVERDGHRVFDRDDLDIGTDPADAASIPCRGDCNADRRVSVDELIRLVNVALSARCRPARSATPIATARPPSMISSRGESRAHRVPGRRRRVRRGRRIQKGKITLRSLGRLHEPTSLRRKGGGPRWTRPGITNDSPLA